MLKYPTVATKLVILLGNPLGHSISPPMHNRVFEKLDIDYCYMPVEVREENLEKVFAGLSRMNVAGFNVTIPHKIGIIKHLDELDPLAATIGAVNTITVKNGRTRGYNTDGQGLIRSLEEEADISVKGKQVYIVGCGGAARAIAMSLAFYGVDKIFLQNRTMTNAQELADTINSKIRPCTAVVGTSRQDRKEAIAASHVLINATNLGMHPHEDISPVDESLIMPHLTVVDIVYNPLTTRLLKTAREKGCNIVPGLGMLIYQGAAAFKLFTGLDPLVEEMADVVHTIMASKQELAK